MGANIQLFERVYAEFDNYIKTSRPELNGKKKRLDEGYNKIIQTADWQIQEFYSVVHEIKTHKYLKQLGEVKVADDAKSGPDFTFKDHYIECVISTFGTTEESKKVQELNGGYNYPNKFLMSRITSSIVEKQEQYGRHRDEGAIKSDKPYMLFISGTYLSSALLTGDDFRDLLLPLLGVGEEILYINKKTSEIVGSDFKRYSQIRNHNDSPINVGYFRRKEYDYLSAIIYTEAFLPHKYSNNNTILFLNPHAKNPINKNLFKGRKAWDVISEKEDSDHYEYGIVIL